MRSLSAAQLLDLWERGGALAPARQALVLLEAACPEEAPAALAALPVGRRDARLLRLRARTLGPRLDAEAACPACAARLEFSLDAEDLLAGAPEAPPEPLAVQHDGYEVAFRLPNSEDLLAVGATSPEAAPEALLARCLVSAHHAGEAVDAGALPEAVVEAVGEGMAEADPLADVRLALECPACGHAWQAPLDVVAFFWAEIERWAPRLLHDVHRLARAYGWHEADILAMSAWRRQHYLNLVDE